MSLSLEEQLKQVSHTLHVTRQQLVEAERMASLGSLTAGIAHEIKNPLNFINNFAEVSVELIEELQGELEGQEGVDELLYNLQQNATIILEHGRRAHHIIEAMMRHARGVQQARELTDLHTLLDEYIHLAYHGRRASQPGFNCDIERAYAAEGRQVAVVPQDIGRVVLNLLTNAFDALAERVATGEESDRPTIRITTRYADGHVTVRIADNGTGMTADLQEKIFEPFFTTKPAGKGTGLGLSLSRSIIEQDHGGTFAVASCPGTGTTFTFTLPV